ncbi:MAG: hypothetical protein ACREN8_11780 [Candidatus Dormibacteraceae bacterium]
MAEISAKLIAKAKEEAGTGIELAREMEPYVGRLYGEDAVSTWITHRVVPPGDALLSAAWASGISIDQLLAEELGAGNRAGDVQNPNANLSNRVETLERELEKHGQLLAKILESLDRVGAWAEETADDFPGSGGRPVAGFGG